MATEKSPPKSRFPSPITVISDATQFYLDTLNAPERELTQQETIAQIALKEQYIGIARINLINLAANLEAMPPNELQITLAGLFNDRMIQLIQKREHSGGLLEEYRKAEEISTKGVIFETAESAYQIATLELEIYIKLIPAIDSIISFIGAVPHPGNPVSFPVSG